MFGRIRGYSHNFQIRIRTFICGYPADVLIISVNNEVRLQKNNNQNKPNFLYLKKKDIETGNGIEIK